MGTAYVLEDAASSKSLERNGVSMSQYKSLKALQGSLLTGQFGLSDGGECRDSLDWWD